jgi:K+/H+ antiporter YhaU regulatory subunit KhtT
VYLGGGLKRTLAIMDTRLDSFVDQLVRSAEGAPGDRATLRNLLQERYPLSAVVMDFMLPPNPTAANLSLAELKLRKTTGATVVSVYRGEACLANPEPDFRILPGDVLCLLGEKEHVQAAFAYLNGLCRQPPPKSQAESVPQLETARIPADSPLIGRSFRDLSLRNHTGATVVGLERRGSLNTAPSPDAPLEGEDVLLLLGNQEAINRARRLISAGDLAADASLDEQVAEAQLRG